jgi:hypothetical protein
VVVVRFQTPGRKENFSRPAGRKRDQRGDRRDGGKLRNSFSLSLSLSFSFKGWGLVMLPRLVLNSCAQAILPTAS